MAANQQKKNGDGFWENWSWVLIVCLFAVGLTPVALVLLFVKLFGGDGAEKTSPKKGSAGKNAAGVDGAKRTVKKAMKPPKTKKGNARRLQIIGVVLLAAGLLGCMDPLGMMLRNGGITYYLDELLFALAIAAAGGGMLGKGLSMSGALQRYKRYLAVLGDREAMPLKEIARITGYSRRRVIRDLEAMIDRGYFGGAAYLHMELDYFCRSAKAAEEICRQQSKAAAPPEAEQGYSGMLRSIRRANDRIADPELSAKIDRLEEVTAHIFRAVEADPAKQKQISTFLSYYLPTTQKLLDSYAEFEAAGIEGENLRQAKQRIRATMDSIVEGFEHQLDALYRSEMMDVDSEIRVMETMLRRQRSTAEEDFGSGSAAQASKKERNL